MQTKNKPSSFSNVSDVQVKLFGFVGKSLHQTLRQQVDTLLITMKFKPSHETVRKYRIKDESLYYFNKDLELSRYYGYDAQWVDSIKKWDYRLVLFDLINKIPVAELLSDNEDSQTVKKFIEESIPSQKRKAIVTDLKPEYNKIMEELGFDHQHCIFHLRLNINKYIREFISEKKSEIRRDYVKNNPNASKSKIKVFVDKKVKEIKKEINIYNELFFELFNQQSYEKAIGFINLLKFEIKNFPEPLKNYLTNNFFPVYKKFLHFLKEKHYGKLDRTNNQTENYIGNTLPKSLKNKYRTRTGLFNYIKHQINRWIKNRKNPLTT